MFAEERPALGPLPLEPFRYYRFGVRTEPGSFRLLRNRPKLAISCQYPSIAFLSCVSRCVVRRHDHCTICCTVPEERRYGKPSELLATQCR